MKKGAGKHNKYCAAGPSAVRAKLIVHSHSLNRAGLYFITALLRQRRLIVWKQMAHRHQSHDQERHRQEGTGGTPQP